MFEGVRAKIKRLEKAVASKSAELEAAQAAIAEARGAAAAAAAEAEQRAAAAVAAAVAEGKEAVAVHLAFIDRLLADKDELGRQLAAATEQLRVSWD